jgi:hypothetical protein
MAILEEKQSSKSGYFGAFIFFTKNALCQSHWIFLVTKNQKFTPAHPPTQKNKNNKIKK